MDDDVSIDELKEWVEYLHGVPATFIEAVEVDERLDGKVVWQGAVKVFALTGHPLGATRAYACLKPSRHWVVRWIEGEGFLVEVLVHAVRTTTHHRRRCVGAR
jgi:hypothetical protein